MNIAVDSTEEIDLALSVLRRDWRRLGARVRTLDHDVTTECARLSLRLHYPALRDAEATVGDLIEVIRAYIPHFCLPRQEVLDVYDRRSGLDDFDRHVELTALDARAFDLFMRAQQATGRSGEAGELLLYLLTEWILEAPQIVAKMSLKTNRDMPVHGSDGVHVKYVPTTKQLIVYAGEAKLHRDVGTAIRSAIASMAEALSPAKTRHELALVSRNLSLSGLPDEARQELLRYLNPMDDHSNRRVDAVTCLIGFNFTGYAGLSLEADPEPAFRTLALERLRSASAAFAAALSGAGLAGRTVELFLLPLPSVEAFRKLFLESLGQRPA